MISRFFCGEIDQRLSILEYDGTKCSGRYRAVIDGDQATVLQLQSVDTKDVPLSNLSLCPGLNETEVLEILSQDDTRSLACIMFLIERVEEDILYRSRDCQLLHDKKLSGELCESCQDLLDNLRLSVQGDMRSQELKVEHVNKVEEEKEFENDYNREPDPDFVPPDEPNIHDSEYEAEMRKVQKPSVTVIRFRKKELPDTKKPYIVKKKECDQCGQEFKSWKLLQLHQLEDHGEVTFVKVKEDRRKTNDCPECQETFLTYRKMLVHAKKVHNLELPLPQDSSLVRCPFCGEIFNQGSPRLASHLKCYHPMESEQPQYKEIMENVSKPFICSDCGIGFSKSKALDNHMAQVHGSHIDTFPCEVCGSFFTSKVGLSNHLKRVHTQTERSHLCVECGKVYSDIALLKLHSNRVHSGEVFTCVKCDTSFNSKRCLRRHIVSKHTDRTMQCDQCDRSFHDMYGLRKHITSVHDKLKPFFCEVCDFKCARLTNLHLHRRKSHNKAKYSKEMLINMVENGEHPKYTIADLAMLKKTWV